MVSKIAKFDSFKVKSNLMYINFQARCAILRKRCVEYYKVRATKSGIFVGISFSCKLSQFCRLLVATYAYGYHHARKKLPYVDECICEGNVNIWHQLIENAIIDILSHVLTRSIISKRLYEAAREVVIACRFGPIWPIVIEPVTTEKKT